MTVSTYSRPNFTSDQPGTPYKQKIDRMARVFERFALWFHAHEQNLGSPAPNMTVRVEAGFIWNWSTLAEKAAQTVEGFTTPSAGQHRIDRVVIDMRTGDARRIAGTPASGSPSAVAPAIPSGSIPCCQILIGSGDTAITNAMITDERVFKNPFLVGAADFDGSNDWLSRGALVGVVDSRSAILSMWVRVDAGDGTTMRMFCGGAAGAERVRLTRNPDHSLGFLLADSGGTFLSSMFTTSTAYSAGATWRHVLISVDLVAGSEHFYVDDVDVKTSGGVVNADIDFTQASWTIAAAEAGASKFNGCIAEVYFAPGQYLDFSKVHNRRKFISASLRPVRLGSDGRLPTGTAPAVYQHLDDGEAVANFATNRGSGGNFTVNGALDAASTSPSG